MDIHLYGNLKSRLGSPEEMCLQILKTISLLFLKERIFNLRSLRNTYHSSSSA